MDLILNVPADNHTLHVSGIASDGSTVTIGTPTFTLESGPAVLSPGPDPFSQAVTVDVTAKSSSVVRVDANADRTGGTRIITARLFLNIDPALIPPGEAVSLILTTTQP